MRKRSWILLVLPLLFATGASAASLQTHSVVHGDMVRVGDLFRDAGDAANAVVGRAPAPGHREVFGLRRLRNIAVLHKLDWTPSNRFVRAVIERSGRRIERSEIENRLKKKVEKTHLDERVRVDLFNQNMNLYAASDAKQSFWLENLRFDRRSARISATVVVPSSDSLVVRVPVTGRVETVVRVPVVNRRIARGQIVRKGDVGWREVPKARVRGDIIGNPSAIVGKSARYALRPGRPVRNGDVEKPKLVARGSLVTLMLETSSMILTTRGKAMENGALGQTVQVVNIRSKRVIEAIVDGPGRVRVPNGGIGPARKGGAS